VLWFSGDVLRAPGLLKTFGPMLEAEQSFVAVNTKSVAE
jgi:hypothetical protein